MPTERTRRQVLRLGVTVGGLSLAGCLGTSTSHRRNSESAVPVGTAHQYSAPGCRCCERYASYLRDRTDGEFSSSIPTDINAIKRRHGIPEDLRSCHTLVVDGYVIEGHAPVEAIATILGDQPAIDGIALPGMPSGAPGMSGEKSSSFVIYAIGGGRTGAPYIELE